MLAPQILQAKDLVVSWFLAPLPGREGKSCGLANAIVARGLLLQVVISVMAEQTLAGVT